MVTSFWPSASPGDQLNPSKIEWPKIIDQVKSLVAVGRACRASFVVLASMIGDYPTSVLDEIKSISSAEIPVHLLTKEDLEGGHRWIKGLINSALQIGYPSTTLCPRHSLKWHVPSSINQGRS